MITCLYQDIQDIQDVKVNHDSYRLMSIFEMLDSTIY